MSTKTPRPAAMSVLQLRSSAGLYGADRMVMALDQGLRDQGVRSRLLSIHNYLLDAQPLHDAAIAAGQDAVLLPCRGRIDTRTVAALTAQIDACAADVLHVHDYKSAFYAWLATRRRRVRLVATLHGWVEASHALRLYNALEIALLRRFDALAVVAETQVERLLRGGVPRDRIRKIDNGIAITTSNGESPSPALRTELGLDGATCVFGAVSRLSPEKNLALLISVFAGIAASHPDVRLLIVGDGPERGALESQSERLGITRNVRFAGARSDMARIYPLLDCLVLPSLSEGMPLVVLEAMSYSIPIIASAVGDVPRLLSHTSHGALVPAGDASALRAAMLTAITQARRRDAAGAAFVQSHHSAEAMAARYLDLYEDVLENGRGRKTA